MTKPDRPTLRDLQPGANLIPRHIGPRDEDLPEMLEVVGAESLDDLIDKVIPPHIRTERPFCLPSGLSERNCISELLAMARRNRVMVSMVGQGYYGSIMPKVIQRRVLENPGWYTAYTPYQAEVSQGRLEALLTFQHMISDLSGLDVANASLLDEATAAAEAMAMAHRVTRGKKGNVFFVDKDIFPQTLAVVKTRAENFGFEVRVGDPFTDLDPDEVFAALFQYPGSSGEIRDFTPVCDALRQAGALSIIAADILGLVLLKSPGEMGADIAVGSAQRFGVPMGYGGPHAGWFATRMDHVRQMPGRVIGVSRDAEGRLALRMALQTREQHIRREKATSNICTAQVLLANLAAFFAVYHGPEKLRQIAQRTNRYAEIIATALAEYGFEVVNESFFDTITVKVPGRAQWYAARAREQRINIHVVDADHVSITTDETTRRSEVVRLLKVFFPHGVQHPDELYDIDARARQGIPANMLRTDEILTHPVFNSYHSETEMMRYLRRLQQKDIALDRSMIPLGSCTMKLNAATEMQALSWREFAHIHPFAPLEQAQGYQQLIEELEHYLCTLTGFDAFSFQPNAGSQGEYAGLLVIKRYHAERGQGQRDVVLIPTSAHGTNPASAGMAGLKVVPVGCDDQGNIDLDDLKKKAAQHEERLAALMITYPSTHGVFEESVKEICDIVHAHGGQVYFDGANMNALVGYVRPAELGADVCHLNLHKTFAIPHGGGGPGVGPVGVKAHLAKYLPAHVVVDGVNPAAARYEDTIGQVAAAPWGSALILTISWAYIRMMGPEGLKKATQVAILNANYIARKLEPYYPVVYKGRGGYVAHECIIDLRQIRKETGITVEDVAKRLVDYGYHAPTMSWPVPDTFMIEPTESESREELDRFIEAMISIRAEIDKVAKGEWDRDNNPLKNAPHTPHLLNNGAWPYPYTKQEAYFPLPWVELDKFWPPVARVDNAWGDRHLIPHWQREGGN
ncbi:aminomethyl-transferring glycine dehydrogenase [Thermopetrobacter sp. TC1]|uniref:aminomethyl-transferring glycine dehydrogenase n=1 Tax=Thermopetrobacter sp. TC1 TaxID=1495045 RepID=UPI00056E6560|nr:aminomethyl-transferring glycine dehydrogenase [Thermopetrobacter sp. TC1]